VKKHLIKLFLLSLVCFIPVSSVWAGSQENVERKRPVEELIKLTKKMERTMADKGARVFIVARTGRPPEDLPEGLKYTHVSFGVYSKIKTNDGEMIPGYAYYNLYQKGDVLSGCSF
jgi:hypothetical protein